GQEAMDMDDAASEILGFFKDGKYDDIKATKIKEEFNKKYSDPKDEFSPIMKTLKDQNELRQYLELADNMSGIMVFFLILAMSIVLWNAGLLGGLRRYYEFGIRLALGEDKNRLYRNLIYEAIIVGFIGSVIGTLLGLAFAYYMQEVGLDVSSFTKDITMMIPTIYRAKVTPELFYIGFIPGLFAMVLGNALAGLAIYRRDTSKLFKELEV
ncbi:MAG TPA: ABC transporter permease, partial [Bacteroidetes bacterium]|nr:ABC transporter permease [Bacteroidota bacterium]